MTESLEELLATLGLTSSPEAELRKKLRRIVAATHPDKNAGSFKNLDHERRFKAATDALETLDRQRADSTSLVAASETTRALVETQRLLLELLNDRKQADAVTTKEQQLATIEARAITSIREATSRTYRPARFGLWSLAGAAALIAALDKPLGGLISEITTLAPYLAQELKLTLAGFAVVGALGGWFALQVENYKNRQIEAAVSDIGILRVFSILRDRGRRGGEPTFDFFELTYALSRLTTVSDPVALEAAADTILAKLERRGAVRRSGEQQGGFVRTFAMNVEFADAVSHSHFARPLRLSEFFLRRLAVGRV